VQAVDPLNNIALGITLFTDKLVTGSSDGTISVYNQDSGEIIAQLSDPASTGKLGHYGSCLMDPQSITAAVQAVTV
jgi:hypothetical protein